MLTAPRVIAALLFAGLGWYASVLIIPHFEARFEGRDIGQFALVNAAFCFFSIWKLVKPQPGEGYNAGLSYGLTAVVAMTVIALFLQSFGEMIRKALDRDYGSDPVGAVVDTFRLMIEFGQVIVKPDVLAVLIGGGILGGLIVEWTGRRWR